MNTKSTLAIAILSALSFNSYSASEFASTGATSNAIISNKVLMVAGANDYGQLKPGSGVQYYMNFTKIMSDVELVSSGYNRTAFITDCGDLFYFGWRTGTTDNVGSTYIDNNAVDVAVGSQEIYYIARNKVYGFNPRSNTKLEYAINDIPVEISAGQSHVVVRTQSGAVYTMGSNSMGQTCQGTATSSTQLVPVFNGAGNIFTSRNTTLMVDYRGYVLGCGDNGSSQLGVADKQVRTPTEIPGTGNALKVASTGSGTFILNKDGTLSMIGWHNYIAQNGSPYNRSSTIYTLQGFSGITDIGAGGDSFFFKTMDGIYAWGGNSGYKLGDGTQKETHTPGLVNTAGDGAGENICRT